jgi:rhodanese-related sulfurtransferase/DNA-binding transcriptional ArsR family regulator
MTQGGAKSALYADFARVAGALASPARIELVNLLGQGERSVDDLAAAARLKVSNTSAQLKVLAEAGLLASRRSGTRVYYRIASPSVTLLSELIKQVACEQLSSAREAARAWLGDDDIEPVTRAELARRLREGSVLVIDVRPAAEYSAGHIAGALGIPLRDLPDRLDRLPRDAEIVAYCRGRFCAMSPEAVRLLREHGYQARVMDGGLPEWRAEGMPVSAAVGGCHGK